MFVVADIAVAWFIGPFCKKSKLSLHLDQYAEVL